MAEEKKQRGGKREGAGRRAVGVTTHPMSLKLDKDLYGIMSEANLNKNRYINEAIRERLKKDGLL